MNDHFSRNEQNNFLAMTSEVQQKLFSKIDSSRLLSAKQGAPRHFGAYFKKDIYGETCEVYSNVVKTL